MADLLRFKRGLAAGLTDLAKSAGTIYVTTDEHAMYVDIDNNTRIRLGDFIVASSLADLATEAYKPYSTTALYYITTENALARYDGSKWVQINNTADLESAITVLEGYVGKPAAATADGKATGLFKDIVELNAKVEAITGGEGEDVTSIAGLAARLVAAEGDIDDLEGVVGDANGGLVKRMTDAEADIDDLEAASTLYNQKLTTLEGENTVVGSIKHTVKTAISDLQGDTTSTVKEVEDKADAAQTAVNTLIGKVGTVPEGSTVIGITDALDNRLDTAESNITALQEKDVELAADIKENTDAIAVLNGDSTTVGSVEYKIAQKLQVADAMTFGGVVKAYSELPATPTKGETYKVGVAGTYGDYVCEVGDLLIANGKETNGVILAADLTWEHVPAGGQDDTNPEMSVANNTITLNSHVGVSLGTATIAGSDAVEVTTSGNTISIDLIWGSF